VTITPRQAFARFTAASTSNGVPARTAPYRHVPDWSRSIRIRARSMLARMSRYIPAPAAPGA